MRHLVMLLYRNIAPVGHLDLSFQGSNGEEGGIVLKVECHPGTSFTSDVGVGTVGDGLAVFLAGISWGE